MMSHKGYKKLNKIPKTVYHYTRREKLEPILHDGKIKATDGVACWFCLSIEDLLEYLKLTALNEGGMFVDANYQLQRYPKFVPEDYVVLELRPRYVKSNWYNYEPANMKGQSFEYYINQKKLAGLKVAFCGDLEFKSKVKVLEMKDVMEGLHRSRPTDTEKDCIQE